MSVLVLPDVLPHRRSLKRLAEFDEIIQRLTRCRDNAQRTLDDVEAAKRYYITHLPVELYLVP